MLNDEQLGPECDLWALGCIIYRFMVGKTPFKEKTEYLIFENIRKNKINFPEVSKYQRFFHFLMTKFFNFFCD